MSEQMHRETDNEGISVMDLFRILKRYSSWMIVIPLSFAVVTLLAAMLMKPVWEATALIKIGQIANESAEVNGRIKGVIMESVESANQVATQLKSASFKAEVFKHVGGADLDADFSLYAESLKAKNVNDLVEIKLRAYSPEKAKKFVEATADRIRATHDAMTQPTVKRLKQQLAKNEEDLKNVESSIGRQNQQLLAAAKTDYGVVLTAKMIRDQKEEKRELEQQRLIYEEMIARTKPTGLVHEVYVSASPVSPNKLMMVIIALVVGLLAALAGAIFHAKSRPMPFRESA